MTFHAWIRKDLEEAFAAYSMYYSGVFWIDWGKLRKTHSQDSSCLVLWTEHLPNTTVQYYHHAICFGSCNLTAQVSWGSVIIRIQQIVPVGRTYNARREALFSSVTNSLRKTTELNQEVSERGLVKSPTAEPFKRWLANTTNCRVVLTNSFTYRQLITSNWRGYLKLCSS